MSFWKHLRFRTLAVVDWLLGTHLVDRELSRLRQHLETFQAQTCTLQQQMEDLNGLLHIVQVQMCVLYLRQRYILRPTGWLRFAPSESADEEKNVDLLISRLVRHQLATVRTETVSGQFYVYYLRPDWAAIADLLGDCPELYDSVTVTWLNEMRRSDYG